MVGIRVFVWAEDNDYLKLALFQAALMGVGQGRRLKQIRISDTDKAPSSIADLVVSTQTKRQWFYKEQVWRPELYAIVSFDVPKEGLWYVVPCVNRVLAKAKEVAEVGDVRFSFSLFGLPEEEKAVVYGRCFRDAADEDTDARS